MTKTDQPSPYDSLPYSSGAYPESHPDLLSGIGRLFGLDSPDPENCRVLEFACADGSNLLPMACEFPNSEFIGIDLSQKQIDVAQDAVRETGIKNTTFHAINLLDADEVLEGKYDYIIAHGLYAWIPDNVKKKLLELSKKYLSPNGIVYISYNTLPGWRPLQALREMMIYHTAGIEDLAQKSGQARAFLNFMANAVPEDDPYGVTLKKQSQFLSNYSDAYFVHDWLETENDPLYFHQFVNAADAEGLQYLGESNVPSMFAVDFAKETLRTLKSISTDQVSFEQYLDFVRNRRFRQTLLCHDNLPLSRDLKAARLDSMYLRTTVATNSTNEVDVFRTRNGSKIKVKNDIARLLLRVLVEKYPDSAPFMELSDELHRQLSAESIDESIAQHQGDEKVTHLLLDAIVRGLVDVSGRCFIAGSGSCDLPRAQAYARYQAKNSFAVTNRLNETKRLDPLALLLIRHLDGNTTRESLVDVLAKAIEAGDIKLEEDEPSQADGSDDYISNEMLQELVNEGVKTLGDAMLLSGENS